MSAWIQLNNYHKVLPKNSKYLLSAYISATVVLAFLLSFYSHIRLISRQSYSHFTRLENEVQGHYNHTDNKW